MLHVIGTYAAGIIAFIVAIGVFTFVLTYIEQIFYAIITIVLIGVAGWGMTYGAYELGSWVMGLFS